MTSAWNEGDAYAPPVRSSGEQKWNLIFKYSLLYCMATHFDYRFVWAAVIYSIDIWLELKNKFE